MKNPSNNKSPGIISQAADTAAGWFAYSVVFTVIGVFVLGIANFVHTFMPWWGLLILGALVVLLVAGAEKRNRMFEVKRMLLGMGLMVVFLSLPHIVFDGPVPLGSVPSVDSPEPGQIDVEQMIGSFKQAYLFLSANLMYILMATLAIKCLIVWRKPD